MSEEETKLTIAIPGEWALRKAFGPVLTEMGEDFRKLYAKGRDKLISAAYRKIRDPDDGKQANLRVTRDVLWNGAFTDDEVCAEYFGGIFAASRSPDGKDDDVIQFVDVIKSLSAKQLRLHYVIYNSLNKLFVAAGTPFNVAVSQEIQSKQVWFARIELDILSLKIDTDPNILFRQGLLHQYEFQIHTVSEKQALPYVRVNPSTFGVLLYAVARNKLEEWRLFDQRDFGDFPDIALPNSYASTLDDLLKKIGLAPIKA
jgi:hypothetical protein